RVRFHVKSYEETRTRITPPVREVGRAVGRSDGWPLRRGLLQVRHEVSHVVVAVTLEQGQVPSASRGGRAASIGLRGRRWSKQPRAQRHRVVLRGNALQIAAQ